MSGFFGYVRCSTEQQDHEIQILDLVKAGVPAENITKDFVSGGAKDEDRQVFWSLLTSLDNGDTLVVWAIDRIARSIQVFSRVVEYCVENGIKLRVIKQNIDISDAAGRLVAHILAAVAEFEREMICARVRSGVSRAQNEGKHCGRPPVNMAKVRLAHRLSEELPIDRACDEAGISRATYYKHRARLHQ